MSDPGIIPNVQIFERDQTKPKPSSKLDYFVKFRNKLELEEMFDVLKVTNPIEKFYHKRKFKYNAPVIMVNEHGEEVRKPVPENEKHN